jgi:hypothetical protein
VSEIRIAMEGVRVNVFGRMCVRHAVAQEGVRRSSCGSLAMSV